MCFSIFISALLYPLVTTVTHCDNNLMIWSLANSVAYECTHEALTHAIGIESADLESETVKPKRDPLRIKRIEAEIHRLGMMRRQIDPSQPDTMNELRQLLIAKIRAHQSTTQG